MSSADFRKSYASESEPVEVTAYGKALGYWFPDGTQPAPSTDPAKTPEQPPSDPAGSKAEPRMTIRPVKESKRPALVAREVRVVETQDERARERARWSALSSRLSGNNGGTTRGR